MIEVYVLETYSLPKEHCQFVQEKLSEGFDIYSNHVTTVRTDGEDFLVYTTYLMRGSRPGQANKASMIEIQGLEIAALRAELVALQEAFKHQSARIDVILREMQGDVTDEAVPLHHYSDVVRVFAQNTNYLEVVEQALAEDQS